MQLAMIKQLLNKKLITDKEYALVKSRLREDYGVPKATLANSS